MKKLQTQQVSKLTPKINDLWTGLPYTFMYMYLFEYLFAFLWGIPRSGIAGSSDSSVLYFWRATQHSQQLNRFTFPPVVSTGSTLSIYSSILAIFHNVLVFYTVLYRWPRQHYRWYSFVGFFLLHFLCVAGVQKYFFCI